MKDQLTEPILTVRCLACGAEPGEKCEASTGQPRTTPHLERLLELEETEVQC